MTKHSQTAILALIGAIATTSAWASSGFTPTNNEAGGSTHAMPSERSRDEVRHQAREAARASALRSGEATYAPELEQAASTRSRAEVVHEAEHARDDKTLRELYRN